MNKFFRAVSGIFFLFLMQVCASQEIPKVKTGNSTLGLRSLNIKVEVVGNIATTTYDMLFYNNLNRELEGELSFPLGENMKVSRFALDLNGNLREAVVVEKELARVAFENTVRRRIDPALLEQSAGNNYKARIYPIPAKGTKRVVLAYEQELLLDNGAHYYNLPLNFKEELEEFSLEMVVYEQTVQPILEKGDVSNFGFDAWKKNYVGKYTRTKFVPNESLKIKIPLDVEKEKLITDKDFFYFYKILSPRTREKEKPREIDVFWDTSYSMENRDLEKEFQLLDLYFKHLGNVKVNLVSFSNEVSNKKSFIISGGNWQGLKEELNNLRHDGGTSYSKLPINNSKAEEILIFTDGLDNLGSLSADNKKPIYFINSLVKSNHSQLSRISTASGGNYVNLNHLTAANALALLQNEIYRFMGVTKSNPNMEIYPNTPMPVTNDFSVAGKNYNIDDKFVLHFGFGNKATEKVEVVLKSYENENGKIEKIWAQKKLKHLLAHEKDEKENIINHSTKHQIISPYTSLIVLDRVEDYVEYEITPPAELLKEYNRLLAIKKRNEASKKEEFAQKKAKLERSYENIADWWKREFNNKPPKSNRSVNVSSSRSINNETREGTISGVVTDSEGMPLPGVNVIINGTSQGTQTDFDGNFSINAQEGDEINISYLGRQTQVIRIDQNNFYNIVLMEDSAQLDEVVVAGYSSRSRNNRSEMVVESVQEVSVQEVSESLQGQVQGLTVQDMAEEASSLNDEEGTARSNSPLYIVNGQVVNERPNIAPNEIEETYVLDAERTTTIYGARAAAGVVVINTKDGVINNREKIKEFEKLVEEKIALKPGIPDSPYLKQLEKMNSVGEAYDKYLELRKEYSNSPSFFIDVADFFENKKERKISIKILTNLAEMDIDNYELLRALAYKLEYFGKNEMATLVYQKILELRPEDIQSYRDLALAFQSCGEYQQALDLFYKIVNAELYEKNNRNRFTGIETIAFVEMNNLISKHGSDLNTNAVDLKYIKNTPVDLRVVIDWNHNDTDIDLWVFDPYNEKCFYSHTKTKIGGRISNDMTQGFGPEEFLLKQAVEGNYTVSANYFANSSQKISGPTFLKVTVFRNYGSPNEEKKVAVYRLKDRKEKIDIAQIKI